MFHFNLIGLKLWVIIHIFSVTPEYFSSLVMSGFFIFWPLRTLLRKSILKQIILTLKQFHHFVTLFFMQSTLLYNDKILNGTLNFFVWMDPNPNVDFLQLRNFYRVKIGWKINNKCKKYELSKLSFSMREQIYIYNWWLLCSSRFTNIAGHVSWSRYDKKMK